MVGGCGAVFDEETQSRQEVMCLWSCMRMKESKTGEGGDLIRDEITLLVSSFKKNSQGKTVCWTFDFISKSRLPVHPVPSHTLAPYLEKSILPLSSATTSPIRSISLHWRPCICLPSSYP